MTPRYRLHYAPDNASLIIRLALDELCQPYETVLVDRAQKAQLSDSYRALNPAGRIPTLETPQGPISETGAILLYLGERHGALVPTADDPARGAFLNWLFYVANTLHPDVIALFYTPRYGPDQAVPEMRAALHRRIAAHLHTLETQATARLSQWFCAAQPSALDLYVAALLRWLQLYPDPETAAHFDISPYPTLTAMCARLETRESVARLQVAEGMSARPFTAPQPPNPPEGVAK